MIAVIMTAGQGMRLRPYTNDRPKGMVEVGGKPLLFYTINFARACGADRIIVIGGFAIETVQNYLITHEPDVALLQNYHQTKGNLETLITALPHIDDSFLLFNADHLYKYATAASIRQQYKGITAFCDTDRILGEDDMKVTAVSNRITQISKQLPSWTHGYVGITYVDSEMLPLYRFTATQLHKTSDGAVAVESIIAHIAAQSYTVQIGDISGYGWFEIDTPQELSVAEHYLSTHMAEFVSRECAATP